MERQAFNELEQVMISASMPKKDRIQIIHDMNQTSNSIESASKGLRGENVAASPTNNNHHYKSEASIESKLKGRVSRTSNNI
jgi:hypothetical protein